MGSKPAMIKRVEAVLLSLLGLLLWGTPLMAAELAEIRQRGHLVVAVKDNLYPLGYRNPSTQALEGFEIDLARQLAEALLGAPDRLVLKPVLNADRLSAVAAGEVDLAIANITVTPERLRQVSFSLPYYRSGSGILTRSPQLNRLQLLYRQAIAVLQPSVTLPSLRSRLPEAQLIGVPSYQVAQELLAEGTVAAIVGDQVILAGWAQTQSDYYFYPTGLRHHPLAIALPKGVQYEPLQSAVDSHLKHLQQTDQLQVLQRRWGLP